MLSSDDMARTPTATRPAPDAPISAPPLLELRAILERALAEDLGRRAAPTRTVVPADLAAEARLIARADGVLAGLPVARLAFELTDPRTTFEPLVDDEGRIIADGARIRAGQEIARITGPARGILSAERVALNFLQRLSGTATLAARYV